jgi:hypothetical protein
MVIRDDFSVCVASPGAVPEIPVRCVGLEWPGEGLLEAD